MHAGREKLTTMKQRAKRSGVWQHFTATSDSEVTCNLCDVKLKYNSSTSTMKYHLDNAHPRPSAPGSGGGAQQTLTSMVAGRRCDARRTEGITQKICGMVEKDTLPISVVDGTGFQELMGYVEPNYTIPSRQTITRRIESRFKEKKGELKSHMRDAGCVAITTDCWTALTTESYLTITAHTIDDEWNVRSFVLLTQSMPNRHTADNLAAKLNEAVELWGLTGKVCACVHDNASNIVSANSTTRVNWDSVRCFAHTLQLAIQDGFGLFLQRVIGAAGRLVKHFNHSTVATKALEDKQTSMKAPQHMLIQSCKTRWNSVYDMFERLNEQRWPVTAVLSDRTVTKLQDARTLELKDEYWQIIEEVLPVLKKLKTVTTVMSTESGVDFKHLPHHLQPPE